MRQDAGLLRRPVGVRAANIRARGGRERSRHECVHARFLPSRAGSLRRGDGDAPVSRDAQEPQAARAEAALPGGQGQALLPARHRAPRPEITAEARVLAGLLAADGHPIGEVYLTRDEIGRRVAELGAELAAAYANREPLLVAPLKSSAVFLSDLSRALPIPHGIDFLELAAYSSGRSGAVKLLKDLDTSVVG